MEEEEEKEEEEEEEQVMYLYSKPDLSYELWNGNPLLVWNSE